MLFVGAGSFFGGIFRYLLSTAIQGKTSSVFPYGTMMVNLAGCLLIGCLFGVAERWNLSVEWRLLLVTGVLGGFTTFSAFSVESVHLLKTGHTVAFLLYVGISVFAGLLLTALGAWLFRIIPGSL